MMTRPAFFGAMAKLAVAFNRELDKPQIRVYAEALADLEPVELEHAVTLAIARETFFPPVAVLRRYAKPPVNTQAEAVRLFERIKAHPTGYSPFIGSYWDERTIRNTLGPAAGEAFMAAGGSSAFESLDERSQPFVRKAFVEAVEKVAAADPAALEPPRAQPKLPTRVLKLIANIGNGPARLKPPAIEEEA